MQVPSKPFDLARLFAALADPTRLRLLSLMSGREVCVCYFVAILDQPQPKISRHLAYLRRAGIVSSRRQGKWMHYRVCWPQDHTAVFILRAVFASLAERPEMRADLAQLEQTCCAAPRTTALLSAPSPISFI
ncbi:MAG TPA: metalloregulator ArsR/SmtB family transcription factor [Acidobacteriaceae bacterium]|nr:metalloregulator ArsR/SmtB family transcription factor [Acidobacteriaceae bacterium]